MHNGGCTENADESKMTAYVQCPTPASAISRNTAVVPLPPFAPSTPILQLTHLETRLGAHLTVEGFPQFKCKHMHCIATAFVVSALGHVTSTDRYTNAAPNDMVKMKWTRNEAVSWTAAQLDYDVPRKANEKHKCSDDDVVSILKTKNFTTCTSNERNYNIRHAYLFWSICSYVWNTFDCVLWQQAQKHKRSNLDKKFQKTLKRTRTHVHSYSRTRADQLRS